MVYAQAARLAHTRHPMLDWNQRKQSDYGHRAGVGWYAMVQMKIFVSHSSEDKAFCDDLVSALIQAGADAWYDDLHLGAGVLRREISEQLKERPVTIVVLSKAAMRSHWVAEECDWAYNLYSRNPEERLVLPVVAAPFDPNDWDNLFFIEKFRRVEASPGEPLPQTVAISRVLSWLRLALLPAPTATAPGNSIDDLVIKSKSQILHGRYTEAIQMLNSALRHNPDSPDAWFNFAYALSKDGQLERSLAAFNQAVVCDPTSDIARYNQANMLDRLGRHEAAIVAYDRATALNPGNARAWYGKGRVLGMQKRFEEALDAYDRALAVDPESARFWVGKGLVLFELGRFWEALGAYEAAIRYDPDNAEAWYGKGCTMQRQNRWFQAERALVKARRLETNASQKARISSQVTNLRRMRGRNTPMVMRPTLAGPH